MKLRLYHGRKDPEQDMEDWGTDGPTLEVEWVQYTYGSINRIGMPNGEIIDFNSLLKEDMIFWEGVYYGDFILEN